MNTPKMRRSMIVAVAEVGGRLVIGIDGERMPWHLPEDLKFFRRTTMGKPVIMGRRTHESIGRALPGRLNIVLSRQADAAQSLAARPVAGELLRVPDMPTAWRVAEAAWAHGAFADQADSGDAPEAFVIGGTKVYAEALASTERLYVTEIHARFEGNCHFPPFLGMQPGWTEVHREHHQAAPPNDFGFDFVTYDRISA